MNIWQFRRQFIALKIGSGKVAGPDFHLHQGVVFSINCLHDWVHYNPYKGVHVSTLEVKKSRAGCIMRPPFFFFNADTDCPHYLLGWVREPGMALEPSPERRSNMNTQTHRTCIRMSQEEYDLLKKKSRAAGLSANAWLMRELERNRPILYRKKETRAAIAFADEAGRDINAVARAFNSGCGTAQQLGFSVRRLAQVVEQFRQVRKLGYPYAV